MRMMIAACVMMVLTGLLGRGQEKPGFSDDEGRILALETAWNHAEQHKDVAALDQLLANTLVYIDYDGSLQSKAQFLAEAKSESLHPEQIINEEMTAYVYGGAAVVTGIYREKGISKGKPYSRRGRFTDTWVKENGTWQCVASQSTLMSK
ncbi:MAG: nuclear transport factor 2 family protein [Candidatus Acidiferrales bacterium]